MCPWTPQAVGVRCRPTVQARAAAVAHDEKRAEEKPWRRWYKTARWERLRRQVLLDHPLCTCDRCQGGKLQARPSSVVHHKRAHRGDPVLFWDRDNLQALDKRCHDRLTAVESLTARRAGKTHATTRPWVGGIGKSGVDGARTVSGAREGMKTKSKDRR